MQQILFQTLKEKHGENGQGKNWQTTKMTMFQYQYFWFANNKRNKKKYKTIRYVNNITLGYIKVQVPFLFLYADEI